MRVLKVLLLALVTVFGIFSEIQAAVVTGVSQTQGLNFGTLDPNNNGSGTGGTIKTNACAVTGSVKALATCTNATFLVSGTNNTSGSNRTRIRVRLLNPSVTLKNGSNSMNITFSLSSSSNVTDQNFTLPTGTGTQSVSVTVYSTLTVSGAQQSGIYNQSSSGGSNLFSFVACNDNVACTS